MVATTDTPRPRPLSPTWSRTFPTGELWSVGSCTRTAVTVVEIGPVVGSVLGSHTVTEDRLRAWLSGDWRAGPPAWPGTYTVVVGHPGGAVVFTDPVHALPIHYCETEGSLVWASSSRALSGLIGAQVDMAWVSDLLTDPAGPQPTPRSPFRGVRTVVPGHRLNVRREGSTTIGRWWTAPESAPRARATRLFRKALEDAVSVRSAQAAHLSCDLSGGLDSTTLCLLASDQVTVNRPLTAWTVHPESRSRGADLDHARAALRGHPDVSHTLLPLGEAELPYGGLARVPATDEPAPSTITAARHVFAYERIRTTGSTLHMTGDGGDALLMQSPEFTLRLAARGSVLRALRDLHGWAKLDRTSPVRVLRRLAQSGHEPCPHWLTQKARDMALSKPARGPGDLLHGDAELLSLCGIGRTAHADAQFASAFGVRLESPFLDRAVVEAALTFRVGDRGSPWSYKPQLVEAMRDLLPEVIAQRRTKGGTDADHHLGLRAHLGEVSALLDGWLAGHGLIDPQAIRAELRAAATGRETPWGLLEPVISAEMWGRAVKANPPPSWVRSSTRRKAER
ncbi:albusnodin/ikarugamycin family macrolactam cyclase [Nocardiopsis lucentensis]|uniref:albusnodin/ikarugamycin family macrolactam cyclase n=1 Tax=Nocardiopsis lucentensis TaxID=53441 RepID=UPI001F4C60F6|nr:albusnodin/ikarugamycin family macrolactam cyclase [Nocardiopsis lucentensis]